MNNHLLVRASAGTGKTFRLVEAYLELVRDHGYRPSEIVAITFTRKAALELRTRIQARLKGLGVEHALLAELARAPIANFHGLALQLLRGLGLGGGLREGVEVLGEEGDDGLLFLRACEEAWFSGEAPTRGAVERLSRYAGLAEELPEALWAAIRAAREDGERVDGQRLLAPAEPAAVKERMHRVALSVRARIEGLRSGLNARSRDRLAPFLAAAPPDLSAPTEEWVRAWRDPLRGVNRQGQLGQILSKEDMEFFQDGLNKALAEELCLRTRDDLALLVDAAWQGYARAKHRLRLVDFADLVEGAVELLEARHDIHALVRGRYRAVLVDEAQDTNRVQRRLVELLAGFTGPAAEIGEPAKLLVVGDRKQSIYTFRGADPASFDAFTRVVMEHGGASDQLTVSRRSSPELILAINSLGVSLFGDDYDSLVASDASAPLGRPGMTHIETPHEKRGALRAAQEAMSVAALVRFRLRQGGRAGDFAVLLASMSYAPLYASALNAAGVPAVLGAGSGFYEQSEIVDLVSMLLWLSDPSEKLAGAVALRSPLCGLSEAALLRLFAGPRGQRVEALRAGRYDPTWAPAPDAAAVTRLDAVLPQLKAAAQVMDPAHMLEYLDRLLDVRAVVLALDGGEQRVANLDRLWELAEGFAASGRGGVARFAREQMAKIGASHKEAIVPIPAAARRAVTIITVHQAKGLEYPVVVLGDLRHGERRTYPPLRYGRELGFVFSPKPRGEALKSERFLAVERLLAEEKAAEEKRLLYVAVTRARREVLLVGSSAGQLRGFAKLLDPWLAGVPASLVAREPAPALSGEAMAEATAPDNAAKAERLWATSEPLPSPLGTRFVLPVTTLETYVQCPRRGLFVHALGLSEPGFGERTLRWPAADDREPPLDPRARGRLAHAILAAMGEVNQRDVSAFVEEHLRLLGYDAQDERLADVREDVAAFLRSALGRRLSALPAAERRHELPFTLELAAAPHRVVLHGQIDLLYWDAGRPVIVDYKHAKADGFGLAAYATQLDAYALAVERICGVKGDIATRLVFLRDRAEPLTRVVTPAKRAGLAQAAHAVVSAMAQLRGSSDGWPGQARPRCEELRCGFVFRCHGKRVAPAQVPLFGSEAGGVAG